MRCKRLVIATLLFGLTLQAQNTQSEKNKSSAERGWRFGYFKDLNTSKKEDKRTIKEILAEMLKVQKEQLKTQKKILAILQEQFDPKPKMVTVNGKKCIANSSADCFYFPLTPEAKRIPVMAQWLKNPTIENAAKYQAWLSKYITHVIDIGISNTMAVTQFGDKYYKQHFTNTGLVDAYGYNSVVQKQMEKEAIKSVGDKIQIFIFLGQSSEFDALGLAELNKFYNDFKDYVEIGIIYPDKETHQKLINIFKVVKKEKKGDKKFDYLAGLLNKKKNVFYGKEYFKKFGIYATPAVVVKTKKDNTAQIVSIGKAAEGTIISKIVQYLKYKKIIPMNFMSNQKQFMLDGNNYSKKVFKNTTGFDLNFSKENTYYNTFTGDDK